MSQLQLNPIRQLSASVINKIAAGEAGQVSGRRSVARCAAPLAVATLLVALLSSCTDDTSDPVEVAAVTRGTVTEVVEAPATVAAAALALAAAVAGAAVSAAQVVAVSAATLLAEHVAAGDAILFKGSRAVGLDKVVVSILKIWEARG